MKAVNRYTFIDYENLKRIKLKPLDKLSERLYIIINSDHRTLPLKLVRKTQKLKCDVRWISANTGGSDQISLALAFQVGKVHSKTPKNISFAIISNDIEIDSLIACVADNGRLCTRVTRTTRVIGTPAHTTKDQIAFAEISAQPDAKEFPFEDDNRTESLKEKTINETIRRLTTTDKPPVNIEELKRYIARSNQENSKHLNIGEIIEELVIRKVISIENQKVLYNFRTA
jgi:predicted trehalose synthase